ncbi:beta strand repeat-containing protein [Methanosphaera sp.]
MNKNIKKVFLLTTLVFLLVGLSALSAAETSDNDTVSADTSIQTTSNTVDDTVSTDVVNTNTKSLKTSNSYSIDSSNYATYFNRSGFIGGIDDGDVIDITSDITPANGTTWTIDKAVTINGNGHTINLNTTSGSYYGNETGAAFIIVDTGSNTNINNITFYNSQIILNNTHYVTISNSEITVSNQRVGQGIGILSIREGSTFVTVENCVFTTTNNGGSSTLVLAGANYTNINNNTITGTGTVGNLVYLTTYNIHNISTNDIHANSHNNITNNVITGPSGSSISNGITITGHDNLIENNTISGSSQSMTTQWMSTSTTNSSIGNESDRYFGNIYNNNTASGSVTVSQNSTVENNTISGKLTLQNNATASHNTAGSVTLNNNTILEENIVNGAVTVSSSNVLINRNNITGTVTVKSNKNNVTITNNRYYYLDIKTNSNVTDINNTVISEVESNSKSLKSDVEVIVISTSTFNDLFEYDDDDECYYLTGIYRNKIIKIGRLTEEYMDYLLKSSLTSTLSNCTIVSDYTLKNIELNLKAKSHLVNTTIYYSSYEYVYGKCITLKENSTIENCTIVFENNYDTAGREITSLILFDRTGTTNYANSPTGAIINSTIIANMTTSNIDWGNGKSTPDMVPITINFRNSSIINSTINITIEDTTEGHFYPSCYGISVNSDNNTITGNNIIINNIAGSGWLYGVYLTSSNNIVSNNNLAINGTNYTNAIYFDFTNYSNNTVSNNVLNLSVGMAGYGEGTDNENVGYGIVFTDRAYMGGTYTEGTGNVVNNSVINNTIYGTGYSIYGIEQFGGDYTTIANNTILLDATTPTGIGVIGVKTNITGNKITVNGKDNGTYPTADYIKGQTTGIYTYSGNDNSITENTINSANNAGIIVQDNKNTIVSYNTVQSLNNTYAVAVSGGSGHNVTFNTLAAKELSGDDSVRDTGSDDVVINNSGLPKLDTTITITPVNAMIGDIINLEATVTAQEGSIVDGGNFVFKLNGKTIGHGVVANGIATLENVTITSAWAKEGTTITATYGGNDGYESSVAEPVTVTVTKRSATATLEQVTGKAGETVTLSVTLTDDATNSTVNSGRVVFKLNGKTLKDAEGNVIYATVENGIASIQYTIPENYAAKDYTLSVVFGDNSYERADSTTTLTVEKRAAKVEMDAITVKAGETVTLSAKVTDDTTSNPVNTGKVVFKLNGKTLKDAEGNVIYATVENGIASIQYTILETYSAKDYTLSAVFVDKTYDRATGNTTLTVTKQ